MKPLAGLLLFTSLLLIESSDAQIPDTRIGNISASVFLWSNLQSETQPCACSLRPLGGLSARFEKMKELSSAQKKSFFIDAGRSLFKENEKKITESDLKNASKIALETFNNLGEWTLLLGDLDLRASPEFLKKLTGVNLVLSNLELYHAKKKITLDYQKIAVTAEKNLWLLSMISPQTTGLDKSIQGKIQKPEDVLSRFLLEQSVPASDFVMIGGSLDYDELLDLANKHPSRNIVFVGSKFTQHRMDALTMGSYRFYVNEKAGKNFWKLDFGSVKSDQSMGAEIFQVMENKPNNSPTF